MELAEVISPDESTVTTRRISGGARDNALRVLFTLALAWASLAGMMTLDERVWTLVNALNPASEGSSLHRVLEDWFPVFVAIVAASIFTALVVRLKPQFLSVPRQVTSLRLWVTLIVTTAIVGVALLVFLVAVTVILDPPGPHPENVQYISLVFWLPPLVVAVITPVASILIAWGWTIRRSRG